MVLSCLYPRNIQVAFEHNSVFFRLTDLLTLASYLPSVAIQILIHMDEYILNEHL